MYTVTITTQGQISIPALYRRALDLDKKRKAIVVLRKGEIVIKPVEDFLKMGGTLKTDKKIPFQKVHKSFENYLSDQNP